MIQTSLARRLGVATTIAVLSVSLVACGGKTTDESPSDPQSSTSDSPNSGDSGETSNDAPAELSGSDFYPTMIAALKDAETFRFSLHSTSEGAASTDSTLEGVMRFDDKGIEMEAKSSDGSQQMVMVDRVMYMKMPDMGTDKWVKLDFNDPSNELFSAAGKAMDPETMFKAMQDPKSFKLLGSEEVDGVMTNHYEITFDSATYMKDMGMPSEVTKGMPPEFGTEMWIDADNLPRKFSQELEIPNPTGKGDPVKSASEGTYSDFGLDVDIQAPPSGETIDFAELMGNMGG